jgi:hypothetical protein
MAQEWDQNSQVKPFDRIVGAAIAELPGVGNACRDVGGEIEVKACVDQRAVFGEWHAEHGKADAVEAKARQSPLELSRIGPLASGRIP